MNPGSTLPDPDAGPLVWSTPPEAYHAVRVMCDKAGLTYNEKDLICRCIMVESGFNINAEHQNLNPATGAVETTDYGIVQINDYYHIGSGKDFASVEEVLTDPASDVAWMIKMYLAGRISMWCSYTSGEYASQEIEVELNKLASEYAALSA